MTYPVLLAKIISNHIDVSGLIVSRDGVMCLISLKVILRLLTHSDRWHRHLLQVT